MPCLPTKLNVGRGIPIASPEYVRGGRAGLSLLGFKVSVDGKDTVVREIVNMHGFYKRLTFIADLDLTISIAICKTVLNEVCNGLGKGGVKCGHDLRILENNRLVKRARN